ncbi:MAG: MBL fold metallo-hydrolase [Candidatus Hodarchaeota archaeon]
MALTSKPRVVILVAVLVIGVVGVGLFAASLIPADTESETIKVTLLANAGIMIEADGLRIYIDPVDLPANYSDLPADIILVTHPHGDHYQTYTIDILDQEDTVFIFPSNMTDAIDRYDAIGVEPLDQVQVGTVNITAFYMYTWAPEPYEPSHPPEANWTSYLIDINGFTIFHSGDSKNLLEYEQIAGHVDVACLPLGPGCQTMFEMEVVEAIQSLEPDYFVPIHFTDGNEQVFMDEFGDDITDTTDCQAICLAHYEYHEFET